MTNYRNHMNNQEAFHIKGYQQSEFPAKDTHTRLINTLQEIDQGKTENNFFMKEKYKGSADLRPDVFSYDPVFLDILFDSGIPEKINQLTRIPLVCSHIQLRKISSQGSRYMGWHRDSYYYNGKVYSNLPPVYKILFYPNFDRPVTKQLKIIPKSHRRCFENPWIDKLQTVLTKKKEIYSSNTEYLFFNTELFHSPLREKLKEGSMRLIYSFIHEDQLKHYPEQRNLHEEYMLRLKGAPCLQ
jgi:hypothetical protein